MSLFQDVRLACRRLATTPGFTALALTILALGIGAHVTMFGLVDGVLLRPLPLPEPDRLVGVYERRGGEGFYPLSLPDFDLYRGSTTVFSRLAAHYASAPLSLEIGDRQEMVNGSVVSPEYFSVLGVEPARGRFFLPEEGTQPGAHSVTVISHALWRSRFGARSEALGATLRINGEAFTVVGVAPEGFAGVSHRLPSVLWIPTSMARVGYRWCEPLDPGCTWLTGMIGRLRPGRSIEDARTEMELLGRHVQEDRRSAGDFAGGLAVAPLHGLHPSARPRMRRLSAILLVAVTLVALVAGVNLSGLLLARSLTRGREAVVRLALGASRWRVVSPFLAETLLLAVAGGAGGLLVARGLGPLLAGFDPSLVPPDIASRPAVLAYAVVVSVVTGVLIGLVPGLHASRRDLVSGLRGGGGAGSRRRPKLLGWLVGVQVALAFVLLAGSALLVQSSAGTSRVGPLDPASVATFRLRPRLLGYEVERAQAVHRQVVRRLEALPGVRSVSLGRLVPPWSGVDPASVVRPGPAGSSLLPEPTAIEVGPRFFETFGFTLVRGRDFDARDRSASAPVVIVNRALAAARWPDGEALGELVTIDGRPHEVVGVVRDWSSHSVEQVTPPVAYTPYWQSPGLVDARFGVRASGDAAELLPTIRRTIREVDSDLPLTEMATLGDRLESSRTEVRLVASVLGASSALALALSAVGLFAVLALAVAERTREIGIRVALGGRRSDVVLLVVSWAVRLVAGALVLGFAGALLVSRGLAHHLYGVSPYDPPSYLAAATVLGLTAASASWWAARRSMRVDPVEALRVGDGA